LFGETNITIQNEVLPPFLNIMSDRREKTYT
jgi:hypothetical protein